MEKQTTLLAVAVLLVTCNWAGAYCGGDGSAGNPYRICTAEDMNQIGANPADWNKHFILVNDVNLAQYTGTQFKIIGTSWNKPFQGVFDGNDHKVWNFTWTSANRDFIGLFGCVGTGGEVKNLGMENVDVNAGRWCYFVGGLVGSNDGTTTNCYSEGSVSGDDYTGGLAGGNSGTLSNCYATGSINGYDSTGGLVGVNVGAISDCYATGSVSGYEKIGGMVGWNREGTVTDCNATGSVSGYGNIGGLVGENYGEGTISACNATGSVTGECYVGGLVGSNGNEYYEYGGTISDCNATGSVTGDSYVGGLVGWNCGGTISNCYATGEVSGDWYTGGLVGINYENGTISDCNVTGSITGKYYVGGLVGSNSGTIENCYFTGSVEGVGDIGGLVGGNSGTIENCYSTGSVSGTGDHVGGLVGVNFENGTISNCYATGDVDGDVLVGGLVAYNDGMITNCYSTGNVSGTWDWSSVGGLVGINVEGTITNCYSTGNVSGPYIVGGLVGDNYYGTVLASFWDVNTSGQSSSAGGTGLPTEQMQTRSTFTDAGWDFVCETANGPNEVWTIKEGVDYPKLIWQWKDYQEWLDVNKPPCWLCPRQCHGDADNTSEYIKGKGYYHVHFKDLNLLLSAWNIKEPNDGNPYPGGPGIAWPDPNICADFDHGIEGGTKTGYFRVHFSDLNILLKYWNVKEPPGGPGIEPNCLDCP